MTEQEEILFRTKEENFKNELVKFLSDYGVQMLEEFFDYWSEPNKKGKMRWELEKTWDLKRRLKRWFDNQQKWSGSSLNIKKEIHGSAVIKPITKLGTSEARINRAENW